MIINILFRYLVFVKIVLLFLFYIDKKIFSKKVVNRDHLISLALNKSRKLLCQ